MSSTDDQILNTQNESIVPCDSTSIENSVRSVYIHIYIYLNSLIIIFIYPRTRKIN